MCVECVYVCSIPGCDHSESLGGAGYSPGAAPVDTIPRGGPSGYYTQGQPQWMLPRGRPQLILSRCGPSGYWYPLGLQRIHSAAEYYLYYPGVAPEDSFYRGPKQNYSILLAPPANIIRPPQPHDGSLIWTPS